MKKNIKIIIIINFYFVLRFLGFTARKHSIGVAAPKIYFCSRIVVEIYVHSNLIIII